ncbi:hypothetical protein PYCC9005_003510 [Savitreella phatthalungensis]
MDRASRERCWQGRDKFFACLDKHGILDPLNKQKDAADASCALEKRQFEDGCVATWVDYFCKKRLMEMQREKMIADAKARGVQILGPEDVRHPGGKGQSA